MNNQYTSVYPVIHIGVDGKDHALEQCRIAEMCGSDGVFFISHYGQPDLVIECAKIAKSEYPNLKIGINLLSHTYVDAYTITVGLGIDMVWSDYFGIDGVGFRHQALTISKSNLNIDVFASIAFKYQTDELDPQQAARNVCMLNFIPTTSGSKTGSPPDLSKVKSMYDASNRGLALASGLDVHNVQDYLPYVTHMLVSTGVSKDDVTFDIDLLKLFISKVRSQLKTYDLSSTIYLLNTLTPIQFDVNNLFNIDFDALGSVEINSPYISSIKNYLYNSNGTYDVDIISHNTIDRLLMSINDDILSLFDHMVSMLQKEFMNELMSVDMRRKMRLRVYEEVNYMISNYRLLL